MELVLLSKLGGQEVRQEYILIAWCNAIILFRRCYNSSSCNNFMIKVNISYLYRFLFIKIDGLSQYSHNFVNMQVNIKINYYSFKIGNTRFTPYSFTNQYLEI